MNGCRKRSFIFTFLIIAFIFAFIFLTGIKHAQASTKKAYNFNLKVLNPTLSGYDNFSLKNFRGHVVVVNFWATWCPPCRAEIPMIKKFYNAERSNGVVVLGINVNNNLGGVRSFLKKFDGGITYPVVYATSRVISNYGGINEIPQTFFISKNGRIMFHWVGEITKGALYEITNKLLNKN
ncbi:MAG: TlpA family protein disulfide reductase [Candidatus Acidulodesulfobacterium acidiphilum]|uniref:TlpA family protein disulfide reductase n=1 Tax=Candidatus Acidulodesulfobacterium acidiphilum TaxID=2597224 RepID=A0A520XGH8_9DELT|nr:MAG: TlpA family protein disulfide reductase [Candidatus Acidulodesulfobacterium acidiphilum]